MTTAAELRASANYSARHRAAGRCVNCPRLAREGRTQCQACADRQRARAAGLRDGTYVPRPRHCSRCGSAEHNARTCWVPG